MHHYMDWDNARFFLAIYQQGTLRAAASQLQVDQATVGRRLAALEQSLGARLFLRTPTGYVPTPAGELARQAADRMEQAALQLQRQMQGVDERFSGTVSVACTDTTAVHAMFMVLQKLHDAHPDIRVILTVATQFTNLSRREADIAVRTVRPANPDLITRHLARCQVGLFAAKSYLAARGAPEPNTAMAGQDVVIYQRSVVRYQKDALCDEPIANARVVLEVNSGLMMLQGVRAGLGIAELPVHLAENDPLLQRVWPRVSRPYDMWLVLHSDLNRTARVRSVVNTIVQVYEELFPTVL
ncbi:DNA-binding transcriptional LysR family regulator [Paralcaligenes ureilyticus]|uniref:DNA-binding transcriptional LysR family regulator n=2 Tax=Paralcaligenes ureilyticus TaxID=627131 RepID=A0A4R3M048_9BURK|nr:DNA-binding transcriptional LysR family regulator [Paralcaligenes ureilyticus]